MTAKEWIIESHGMPETEEHANEVEMYAELMNEYALHIAERAVDDIKKESIEADLHDAGWNGACNSILSRIKTLTNETEVSENRG